MTDLPPQPEHKKYFEDLRPAGRDPASPPGLGNVAANDDEHSVDRRRRNGHFGRWTWVMIVVAGVLLGVALAMMAAGA